MKVLQVSGAKSWGGNEQQLVDSIEDLKKKGADSIVFCYQNSPLEEYLRANNLDFISVPEKKSYSLSLLKLLKKSIVSNHIDIVHVHTSNAVTTCVLTDLIFRPKVPIVFSKKGISKAKKGLSAYKYNYKNIKSIICVSKAVKESFKDTIVPKNHHKLEVVYDGIRIKRSEKKSQLNVRKNYNIDSKTPIIGNIANHTRAKDLKTYVKSINHLVNVLGVKDVFFFQIGKESKYSEDFMPMVEEYKLQDYVCFAGFVENAMDVLSQFDVYFMTSEREGLPITIYEAFYKKIPVVSTRAGGIPEAIIHNENGFLSEVEDYKDLASNLEKLLLDTSKKELFGKRSYDMLMNNFTSKQLAENTVKIYKKVINEN
ncbi:glycosyltransferase family 4 protein [Aquimarina longa]|uniref:glycosyltransferase family 4 protein n=1 Tax=Aquimarina longa TaxID=1080221 RepID=UPI0007850DCA|nr:glycosyltransferase family 4 protein [Aquimarina longa]